MIHLILGALIVIIVLLYLMIIALYKDITILENELYIQNDAIDSLYEEVFPD